MHSMTDEKLSEMLEVFSLTTEFVDGWAKQSYEQCSNDIDGSVVEE